MDQGSDPRRRTGAVAEELVARRLAGEGWRLLARNARTRFGELDIVALDGDTLVFVEVKAAIAGAAFGPAHPLEAVGPRKQRQVRRLAAAWMAANRDLPRYVRIRFDAVGVSLDRARRPLAVEHLRGAF